MIEPHLTLRGANVARQEEWQGAVVLPLTYRSNELAGEVGEVLEILGEWWRSGDRFRRKAWVLALADELADVVICADLVGLAAGLAMPLPALRSVIKEGDHINDLARELGAWGGAVCNTTKKLEREALGLVGSRSSAEDLRAALDMVLSLARSIAARYSIDLAQAVAEKFNQTSNKNGLKTVMAI